MKFFICVGNQVFLWGMVVCSLKLRPLTWAGTPVLHCAQHLSASDSINQALLLLSARHVPGMNEFEHCSIQIRRNLYPNLLLSILVTP